MSIICCATASRLYAEETKSTFSFASRAKLIKTSAQINEIVDPKTMIRRLQRQLAEARRLGGVERIQELEAELTGLQTQVKEQEEEIKRLHINQSDDDFDDGDDDDESIPIDANLSSLPRSDDGLQLCAASSGQQSLDGSCADLSTQRHGETPKPSTERDSSEPVVSYVREVQNLNGQLDKLESEQEARLQELRAELEITNNELQNEAAARETLQVAFDSLQRETVLMQKSMTDCNSALEHERGEAKRLGDAEKELKATNRSLVEHNLELVETTNRLEAELQSRGEDYNKETQTLRIDMDILQQKLLETELQSRVDKTEIESLRKEKSALEKELVEAQGTARAVDISLEKRLDNEIARNDKLMFAVKEIEASKTQIANEKALVEATVATLEHKLQSSNKMAQTLKQQFDQAKRVFSNTEVTLKRGTEGYQVEIKNLRQQLDVSKQEIAALNEKLSAYPEKKVETAAAPHWTIVVNKKKQTENPNPANDTADISLVTRDENVSQANTTILNNFYATQTRLEESPSSTQQFICWHDRSTGDSLRWTALFVCPLSAEVFLAAPYTLQTIPAPGKEPTYKDDLFWFPNKNMAKCGAAGRALDCFAYRQSGLCVKRFGCATPYNVPMEFENVRRMLGSKEQEILDLLLRTAMESQNNFR